MLDELKFETDDAGHPRSHRRKRGGRTALTLIMVLVLLGTVTVAGAVGFDKVKSFFTAEDYEGDGNGVEVQVTVNDGDGSGDIGNTLFKAGVVKSAQAFVDAAATNPDAMGIQPGTYTLEKEMSGEAAVKAMTAPGAKGSPAIEVASGMHQKVYETLAASTGRDVKEFEKAGEDPEKLGVPSEWFTRKDGQEVEKSIEGFLLPDTYQFKAGSDATAMLKEMVSRFLAYAEESGFVDKVKDLEYDMSPYEALIIASLTQGEASSSKPEDFGKVARVVYNRLHEDFPCGGDLYNCLEFDSTLNYGIVEAGGEYTDSGDLTKQQLEDPDNQYNTHVYAGLTPTPINSPSKEALDGAVNPPEGNWKFFVAVDQEGTTKFADTVDEFDALQMEACQNGVFDCDAVN